MARFGGGRGGPRKKKNTRKVKKKDPLFVDGERPRPLYVDYKNLDLLSKLTNRHGRIVGRRKTDRPVRADGGQTANAFLMQFQADILDRPVEVAAIQETTALGAAYLAGRGAGVWRSDAEVAGLWQASARYEPEMSAGERMTLQAGWNDAVRKAMTR